jgi:methionyl-tRNA synthetase
MDKNFYITTTLPYTNSNPHIGFAKEIIKADVIARWQRLMGKEVLFNTGTDEHGIKIWQEAKNNNLSVNDYCQPYVNKFYSLKSALNLTFTNFIRTSEEKHVLAAQEFWQRCLANGDIYKKDYRIKYCVGCEMEKTDSDLVKGVCPFHPNRELEEIKEENYFFKFSKFGDKLLAFYEKNPNFVLPKHRFKEIKNFVASGLKDFSISRLKDKMPNGVPVPGDNNQVMYVWFDALVNYISTLDWPNDLNNFSNYWPALQVCGKDNLRQQTAMWPAMLMSAGLTLPKQVLIFGFLTVNGQKIGKSLGNAIDPFILLNKYGDDALRYYLLNDIPTFEDGDFSEDNLKLKYNTDLANVLGNFASRLSNLIEKNNLKIRLEEDFKQPDEKFFKDLSECMSKYRLAEALHLVWHKLRVGDEKLTKAAPWKNDSKDEVANILETLAHEFYQVVYLAQVFLPTASRKILTVFEKGDIKKIDPLFPKIN